MGFMKIRNQNVVSLQSLWVIPECDCFGDKAWPGSKVETRLWVPQFFVSLCGPQHSACPTISILSSNSTGFRHHRGSLVLITACLHLATRAFLGMHNHPKAFCNLAASLVFSQAIYQYAPKQIHTRYSVGLCETRRKMGKGEKESKAPPPTAAVNPGRAAHWATGRPTLSLLSPGQKLHKTHQKTQLWPFLSPGLSCVMFDDSTSHSG